jgi:hypothetical protein
MKFQYQKGDRDCFPTCFKNALLFFGVEISPPIYERLAIFDNGTESCMIHAAQERLPAFERSLLKFWHEWSTAVGYFYLTDKSFAERPPWWAILLLEMGIEFEYFCGPIEHREIIEIALSKKKMVICDVRIPHISNPNEYCKHAILIVKEEDGYLLIHDPLKSNECISSVEGLLKYATSEIGTNLKVEKEYFYSASQTILKPDINPDHCDTGFCFEVISRKH